MKCLEPRQLIPGRHFTWSRLVDDKECTWRLFRRDCHRRLHMFAVSFSHGTDRHTIAFTLWHARIALRNRVDEIDLQAMDIAA